VSLKRKSEVVVKIWSAQFEKKRNSI